MKTDNINTNTTHTVNKDFMVSGYAIFQSFNLCLPIDDNQCVNRDLVNFHLSVFSNTLSCFYTPSYTFYRLIILHCTVSFFFLG